MGEATQIERPGKPTPKGPIVVPPDPAPTRLRQASASAPGAAGAAERKRTEQLLKMP